MSDLRSVPTQTEIESAARAAGAHEFIRRLPQGYDSELGKWISNGVELSGGEWQRIAMARAYLREAPVMLLDEPTSFLDSWNEADWFDRFRELAAGRTSLIITHRFTIAMQADIIHVMDDGEIVESGSHHELLQLGGFYAASWDSQMRAGAEDSNSEQPLAGCNSLQPSELEQRSF
jgi:ATP-binding cassette subfamily B protein